MSFTKVATLRGDGGLCADITQKQSPNGFIALTFALYREYEVRKGAETKRTSFLTVKQLEALPLFLQRIHEEIQHQRARIAADQRQAV